jgi:hypothetical protein
LLIGLSKHLRLQHPEALHLFFDLGELLFEMCGLCDERLRWFLSIGGIELAQIGECQIDCVRAICG